MNSNYRHPQHDEIVEAIRSGLSDPKAAAGLGVGRSVVRRIRHRLGVKPFSAVVDTARRITTLTTDPDADGHVLWTGSVSTAGVPVVRFGGRDVAVARVVYERRTGRAPVGIVKADCGVRGCVAPAHIVDEIERRSVRLLLRNVQGLCAPWDACRTCGADWNTHGRVDSELKLYCRTCNTARRARSRKGKAA